MVPSIFFKISVNIISGENLKAFPWVGDWDKDACPNTFIQGNPEILKMAER